MTRRAYEQKIPALGKSRQLLSRLSLPLATLATLGLVTLAVMLSAGFVQLLLNETLGVSRSPWWLLRNVLIANVLAGILLRYFYLQQQLREGLRG